MIEKWRLNYNAKRPHSALGYRPPAPVVDGGGAGLGCGPRSLSCENLCGKRLSGTADIPVYAIHGINRYVGSTRIMRDVLRRAMKHATSEFVSGTV